MFIHQLCIIVLMYIYKKNVFYQCAVALGSQGKELTAIYYSIAQTYKDNKQYKLSIEYSWKEFEILKDNPSEVSS